jgi:REP element-mobilizing transposase RayT
MRLNRLGRAVEEEWLRSAKIRAEIELDAFIVMPNHVHGVVWITNVGAQGLAPLRPDIVRPFAVMLRSLGSMIRGFKSSAKIHVNRLRGTPGSPVWQRNYYERILRNERDLAAARQYVFDNPQNWAEDKHNPLVAMQSVAPT